MKKTWIWPALLLFNGFTGCAGFHPMMLTKDPLTAAEHHKLGDSYLAHGEKDLAKEQYELALQDDRRFVPAIIALGNMDFNIKNFKGARRYFERAVKLAPNDPIANNNLAMVDVAEGRHLDDARRRVESVLPNAGAAAPYLLDTLSQIP